MAKVTTIKELVDRSIEIKTRIVSYWPQFREEEMVDISEYITTSKFNGRYAMNNSTISFVLDNRFYVTIYTRSVMQVLANAGFKKTDMYVPFSNWDYPRDYKAEWDRIVFLAKQEQSEHFVEDCNAVADEKEVSDLPEEVLRKAFLMPNEGVKVHHIYFDTIYYPICVNEWLSEEVEKQIGTYCSNNGRVCFLDRNGRTYVAKSYKIISMLQDASYKSGNLFVPFSNGEQIEDTSLREAWDRLGK